MWWKIIIAGVLVAHGLGHTMGFLASWTAIPSGLTNGHWMLSNDVAMNSALGRAFGLLWLVAMIGMVGAGLGLFFNQEWWSPLAIASSVISLVAILPWLNLMPTFSAVGAVLIDVVVLLALLLPWGERIVRELR